MRSSLMVRRVLLLLSLGIPVAAFAQIGSLKTVTVPAVPDLERYVRDRHVLLVLGKSLFWDMQVGSDGRTACATCHFHAGADHRAQNQISNPKGPFEPNHLMTLDDFPFRVFADTSNNQSPLLRDSGQRTGSAGIVRRSFLGLTGVGPEEGIDLPDAPAFRVAGRNTRQVTPRNAPSIINAALNVRNFFDGRASDVFTGRTPFGDSDPRPNALVASEGQLAPERVRLTNSSLASQAVAPPVNPVEMSYEGRTWPTIGRKLLSARPLANQNVEADDSVLGAYANPGGPGLDRSHTYFSLVQAAFQPAYWDSTQLADENGFTQAESNFSLFFGLAIQAYESTLIADDSRYDQYTEGKVDALTARERSGLAVLETRAFCPFCHSGPELTTASFTYAARKGLIDSVLTGKPGSLELRLSDSGFFHTGVRPAAEDPGLEALDDFGVPISLAARSSTQRLAIDGAFKVPSLRNVEFTGPYFQNGGQATLEQVVDFYARGGDFPDSPDLPVEIVAIPLAASDRADLVAFLKSLTDDRVRFERAPFDHPELCVPTGYPDSSPIDRWAGIPAVGRGGNPVPLQTFEELLRGVGTDGSRTHTLTDRCAIP
uniref:Cytochrome c domain-containing protein n=1 Tax=Solibacter usitatus (strain Ellin6076) TaxID=234267 RepID=Q02AY3_SOLUE